jgi:hypothetical protein
VDRLTELVDEIELHCPCGARPESLNTHPHVLGCPVEELKRRLSDAKEREPQPATLSVRKFAEKIASIFDNTWEATDPEIQQTCDLITTRDIAIQQQATNDALEAQLADESRREGELRKLVEKWREQTKIGLWSPGAARCVRECADELEAAIAAERSGAKKRETQRDAEIRLDEARQWSAHRPGDGFYDRRVRELEALIPATENNKPAGGKRKHDRQRTS